MEDAERERERESERERDRQTDRQRQQGVRSVLFDDAVNYNKYTALVVYELNMSMGIDGMVNRTTRSNRRTSCRIVPYFQQKSNMYWCGIERGSPR